MTARLRIQELPSEVDGDTVTYPFIWVLDRVGDLPAETARETVERLGTVGGPHCRGVAVFSQEVELADDARLTSDTAAPTDNDEASRHVTKG
jgi:hypothetical protein